MAEFGNDLTDAAFGQRGPLAERDTLLCLSFLAHECYQSLRRGLVLLLAYATGLNATGFRL